MKKAVYVLLILIISSFFSCKESDRLVDNSVNSSTVYALGKDDPAAVKLIEVETGKVLYNDIYLSANGEKLPGAVSQIRKLGNSLYLFMPEAHKVYIISVRTYEKLDELDFSSEGLNPCDYAYANSSTAYVCFDNANFLRKWDLTNNILTLDVLVGNGHKTVDFFENQIYIANRDDNTVSIVDSRTDKEEAVIKTPPAPSLLRITPNGERALVISLGDGKINDKEKTEAIATIINLGNRKVEKTIAIGNSAARAIEQHPLALAINDDDMAFVQTKEYLLNFNPQYSQQVGLVNKIKYLDMIYDPINETLMMLEDNNGRFLVIADKDSGAPKTSAELPGDIYRIFLL